MHSWKFVPVALLAATVGLNAASAQSITFPNAFSTTATNTGVDGVLSPAPRAFTYQMIIGRSELANVPLGARINGITWRLLAEAEQTTWPPAPVTFIKYNVELSTSRRAPNNVSLTFVNNVGADAVDVREGPLTIPAGAFRGGALAPQRNPWGFTVPFSEPYTYVGGDLCITIRQSGHDGGASNYRFLEAVTPLQPGWGTRFAALIGPGVNATSGNWLMLSVSNLRFVLPRCPADLNGDDLVDFSDLLIFMNSLNAGAPQADLNADGVVDFQDLLVYLNRYNAPC
jgi:hypothetical protein